MNFLLLNPLTAVKRVLSKKLELYLEANKFFHLQVTNLLHKQKWNVQISRTASNQTFTLHKNLDTKLFRMPLAVHSSIPFSLFLCRLEMCHPFSQILPYL
jgi:hypothetical protein